MRSNAARLSIATIASALSTLGIQIVALLALKPVEYGLFSVVYLAGAFVLSFQLSTVSEAWVRSDLAGIGTSWHTYSSMSIYVATIGGAGAALVSLALGDLRSYWWLVLIAVACTSYRASARFHELRELNWRSVLLGDIIGASGVLIAAPIILFSYAGDIRAVLVAWSSIALLSAVSSRTPRLSSPTVVLEWIKTHRRSIRPLLRDSLVMDATSIGTPYIIAPLLGVGAFGIYRAVSNVAAPVRLLINPLRPRLSTISSRALHGRKMLLAILAGSIFMGTIAATILSIIGSHGWEFGTLSALSMYAIPTGLFVAANLLGHTYYLIARQHSSERKMLLGRLTQTVLSIALPIFGALSGGLVLAIWGYTIATLISAATWALLVTRHGNDDI